MSEAYPTRDRIIPARWWLVLLGRLEAMDAATEVVIAHGSAHGQSLAEAGKKAEVKAYARQLRRRAYPMLYRIRPAPAEE